MISKKTCFVLVLFVVLMATLIYIPSASLLLNSTNSQYFNDEFVNNCNEQYSFVDDLQEVVSSVGTFFFFFFFVTKHTHTQTNQALEN